MQGIPWTGAWLWNLSQERTAQHGPVGSRTFHGHPHPLHPCPGGAVLGGHLLAWLTLVFVQEEGSTGFLFKDETHCILRRPRSQGLMEILSSSGGRCIQSPHRASLPMRHQAGHLAGARGDLRESATIRDPGGAGCGEGGCVYDLEASAHKSAQDLRGHRSGEGRWCLGVCIRRGRATRAKTQLQEPLHPPCPSAFTKQSTTRFLSLKGKHNYQWNWELQISK